MKKLIAVVLAGGSASRFWPFATSKVLFPFLGTKLFDYSVSQMLPPEVTDVVIISNNDNKKALESVHLNKPTLAVLQPQPLGMADALLSAAGVIKDAQLLIIIADDVVSPSPFRSVVTRGRKGDVFAVLPSWKPDVYFPGGYLRLDGERVLAVVEKPGAENTPSPRATTSGHFIADSNILLTELARMKSDCDDVYERTITMLAMREKITHVPFTGTFASLKYPWNVLDIQQVLFKNYLKPHRGKHTIMKSNVFIEGIVAIGENVKIFENAKIIGPCYIGDNTVIGNNSIIRESSIGNNCVIGFNTDITRSYIGDDCWFHSNYIGDSVLEGNISMGAGAALANLRLDDGEIFSLVKGVRTPTGRNKLGSMIAAGARIGVNVSVMPGIKMGSKTFVGSGIILDKDIPEKSFVAPVKNSYTVGPNTQNETANREEFKKLL